MSAQPVVDIIPTWSSLQKPKDKTESVGIATKNTASKSKLPKIRNTPLMLNLCGCLKPIKNAMDVSVIALSKHLKSHYRIMECLGTNLKN